MTESRFSSIRRGDLAPVESGDCPSRSHPPGLASRPRVNPNALTCFWAAMGFTGLAVLVFVLPKALMDRAWLQVSSLLIAVMAMGLHRFLQVTVFDEADSQQNDLSQVTIIDVNKLQRLS